MNQISWGRYIQRFRHDRGLTLIAAVKDAGCAPSTLSRFEHDDVDISVTRMRKIMQNIAMDRWDFQDRVATDPEYLTDNKLLDFINGDLNQLRQYTSAYTLAHRESRPLPGVQYTKMIYQLAIEPTNPNHRLRPSQEDLLAQLLQPHQGWSVAQRFAIYVALRFASHELLTLISHRLSAYANNYNDHNILQSGLSMEDLGILLAQLVAHRELGLAREVNAALEHTENVLDHNFTTYDVRTHIVADAYPRRFAQAVLVWGEHDTANTAAEVRNVIHDVRNVGMDDLSNYYQSLWDAVQSGITGWHNAGLQLPAVHPQQLTSWAFTGTNLHHIRTMLGLSLADVAVDWTVATQSRFEHGQTQLGFIASLKLLNALLLDAKILFGTMDWSPENAFSEHIRTTPVKDPKERVLVALQNELAALPPKPRNLYLIKYGVLARHAVTQLTWLGLSLKDARDAVHVERSAAATVEGVTSTRWIQASDIHLLRNSPAMLNKDQFNTIWRHIFSHTRLNTTSNDDLMSLSAEGALIYFQTADIVRIHQIWQVLIQKHPTISMRETTSITAAQMACRLFIFPEQADTTLASMLRAEQAMRNFAPAALKHTVVIFHANPFTVFLYYLSVFRYWQASGRLHADPEKHTSPRRDS